MSSFGPQGPRKVFFESQRYKGPLQPVSFKSTSARDVERSLALRTRTSPGRSSALRGSGSAIASASSPVPPSARRGGGGGGGAGRRVVQRPPSPEEVLAAPAKRFGQRTASILEAAADNVFELDGNTPQHVARLDPEHPFDLKYYARSFPEHQMRTFKGNAMYTPDAATGLSKWPIPGMQGSRSPWKEAPFADNGDDDEQTRKARWTTMAKAGTEQGLGVPKHFKSGKYESTGLGLPAKWSGEFSMEQLETQGKSYFESPLMGAMLPGQGYKHGPG
jgi:hypothetical protein